MDEHVPPELFLIYLVDQTDMILGDDPPIYIERILRFLGREKGKDESFFL